MSDHLTIFAGLIFLLAGFVKGMLGLGLPTIAVGLLAVSMPPAEAGALLVVPSLVTNVWQMLAGPHLKAIARRLWSMMLGVCIGTLAGAGLLTGAGSHLATIGLGAALVLYAGLGLAALRWTVHPASERWLAPIIGAITGVISAATGAFVIPAAPYLQAISLDKDDLVQALGLSFTVSTIALAAALAQAQALTAPLAIASLLALLPVLIGIVGGQFARRRLPEDTFRRVFFAGLLALGLYLIVRGIW
jgi:uncharacterized protein